MADAELAAKFTEAEIVPQIIPNPPLHKLQVKYECYDLSPGDEKLYPKDVKFGPRCYFKDADPEGMYTLVMLDPDNLSRKNPCVAEWLHWLVANIPASNLHDGVIGGQVVMPYGSPGPQPRTGKHRYILLLWEHTGRRVAANKPEQRAKFCVRSFQEKHKLGDPIAGNFYITENRS